MSTDIVSEEGMGEDSSKLLDYDEIVTISSLSRQKKKSSLDSITEEEQRALPMFIKDMVKHIGRYARKGESKFSYDCSKLSKTLFLEIAKEFKKINSKFFVVTDYGRSVIIVEWNKSNEV